MCLSGKKIPVKGIEIIFRESCKAVYTQVRISLTSFNNSWWNALKSVLPGPGDEHGIFPEMPGFLQMQARSSLLWGIKTHGKGTFNAVTREVSTINLHSRVLYAIWLFSR